MRALRPLLPLFICATEPHVPWLPVLVSTASDTYQADKLKMYVHERMACAMTSMLR